MTPYVLLTSLVFFILCYGLMHRPVWMWYLAWVFFYLLAGHLCQFFFHAMFTAETHRDVFFSVLYLMGGLTLWLPTVWMWIKIRHKFTRRF